MSGILSTDFGFAGQKLDSDGLMYYGSRYYDAYLNRFIQPDPVSPKLVQSVLARSPRCTDFIGATNARALRDHQAHRHICDVARLVVGNGLSSD